MADDDLRVEIAQRERRESALKSALDTNSFAQRAPADDILQFTIEEAVRLTASQIGFFHFITPDEKFIRLKTWSKNTLKSCDIPEKDREYPVSEAGVWMDALHQRRPVIHNDYASVPHKKGLPEGHVPVVREMVVPVVENGRVVAILGVGNRETDYDKFDVEQLTLLAENTWGIIQRKLADEELRVHQNALEELVEERTAHLEEEIADRRHAEGELANALRESRSREAEVSALLRATRAIPELENFDLAAREIYEACKALIGATSGYVALLSEDGAQNEVVFLDAGGLPCDVDPELPMPIRGLRAEAYAKGEAVYDNDFANSQWMRLLPERHVTLENVLFAPLKFGSASIGLLGLANKPGGFTERDKRLAESFGEVAAVALRFTRDRAVLRHSEERAQGIVSSVVDVMVMMDRDLTLEWGNERALALFGSGLLGRKCFEVLHDTDSVCEDCPVRETLADGQVHHRERRIPDREGAVKDFWCTSSVAESDADGRPVRVVEILRDITDRKRAEHELRDNEERYRCLVETESDAIFLIGCDDGRILEVNKAACSLYGYNREELLGMRSVDLSVEPEKTAEATRNAFPYILVRYHRKREGTVFPVEVAVSEHIWKGKQVITEAVRDITERLEHCRALRESEVCYRELFDRISSGVAVYQAVDDGADFVFVDFNQAAERIEKTPREALIGKRVTEVFPDVEKFGLLKVLQEVCRTGKPTHHPLSLYKDERVTGWRENFVYRLPSGEIVAVYEDITEQKQAEEERLRLEERLRQAQKMEAIGTLAGGIAHDFNNILGAIVGYTELALDRVSSGERAEKGDLAEVLKAAERARELVKQILAFSRQSEREKSPVAVGSLVKEALRLLRGAIPATVEIRQDITPGGDTVLADPTQLHQVVMNLCTNAWQAMRDGGGQLRIRLAPTELDAEAAGRFPELAPGPYMALAVSDTGCGIESENLERVFDPFFTTKERGQGTGMGLAVVHGIVVSHDGAITVESEVGKGSTFRVLLPTIEATGAASDETAGDLPRGSEHVLLVDDEEALRNVQGAILLSLGYIVTARPNGTEAWQAFVTEPDAYDLVLTDLTMPKMTGLELAKKLLEVRADIPIILCTGYSEEATPEDVRRLGVREMLIKPVRKHELAVVVRRILDRAGPKE